jgi:hypothetical protein
LLSCLLLGSSLFSSSFLFSFFFLFFMAGQQLLWGARQVDNGGADSGGSDGAAYCSSGGVSKHDAAWAEARQRAAAV